LRSDFCTFHLLFRRIVLLRLIKIKSRKVTQTDCGLLNGTSSVVVAVGGVFPALPLL
jgi:hypothetical protein